MNPRPSYDRLWQKRLAALNAAWPDFLRGNPKALHKVRVASRRIREALPVVGVSAPSSDLKKLRRKMRHLTRSLGPIRELDVGLGLLDKAADRDEGARPAIAFVRREVALRRQGLRHELGDNPPVADLTKLIKKLERIEATDDGQGRKKARRHEAARRRLLATRLLRRANKLGATVEDAGPLYAPERIHLVRISVKKLRYTLELAHEAGEARALALVNGLKKQQERLGRLHDLQVLVRHVRAVESSPRGDAHLSDLSAYADLLDRECRRLHAEFVEGRHEVVECVERVRHDLVPGLMAKERTLARVTRPRHAGTPTRLQAR